MFLAPLALLPACGESASTSPEATPGAIRAGGDWTRFGYDAARSNSGPRATGITAANVGSLVRRRVELPGTVDSSPIYLRAASMRGRRHDVFVVTTSYGRTLAVDANSGAVLPRSTSPESSEA